jgi:ABC-type transport system substrate-binding protein
VRKALQLALNRQTLLDAIYDGAGKVEHGIYPHGLLGFNPDLAAIPYDPAQARELLTQAGVGDGFDLDVCLSSTCTQRQHQMINLAISMWGEVGVRARLSILPDEEFMEKRKAGMIP